MSRRCGNSSRRGRGNQLDGAGDCAGSARLVLAATAARRTCATLGLHAIGAPHNETTIAINAANPNHAVGAYHSYVVPFHGATAATHIMSARAVTPNGRFYPWVAVAPDGTARIGI